MALEGKGYGGQMIVDDDWVTIDRKGGAAKLTHGLSGSKRIPLANITSVQFKNAGAVTNGFIQLTLLGGSEAKRGLGEGARDENTVMFTKRHQQEFDKIRDHIEQRVAVGFGVSRPAAAPATDVADQLTKLAALRDQGILNDEEFAAQKAKLLG